MGAARLTGLRIAFQVEQALTDPQPARIQVWNLGPSRSRVEQGADVLLLAGYGAHVAPIYRGRVGSVVHERQGVDVVTTISGERLSQERRAARPLTVQYDGPVSLRGIVEHCAEVLGLVPVGLDAVPDERLDGWVWDGSASAALAELLHPRGVTWAEHDEQLVFSSREVPLQGTVIAVGPQTGLVGTPSLTDDGVKASALLDAGYQVGGQVELQSQVAAGLFRIRKLLHRGDLYAETFQSELTLVPVSPG